MQSSYTLSKSDDTTQASTFFSDATNGTTTAFPEFIPDYNKGLSDFHAKHNWVLNFTWDLPFGRTLTGAAGAVLGGLAGLRHLDDAQRQSADGVRAGAIARDRSGTRRSAPASAAIARATRRDAGPEDAVLGVADAVVRSHGVCAAGTGHVRQYRPRRLHRARTCARSTWCW